MTEAQGVDVIALLTTLEAQGVAASALVTLLYDAVRIGLGVLWIAVGMFAWRLYKCGRSGT